MAKVVDAARAPAWVVVGRLADLGMAPRVTVIEREDGEREDRGRRGERIEEG